ncbi:hypothetical protein EI42_06139 [Thermosporothrix hazakensis]|jgi:hypothetical protein|uniref:Uncharacterized protein n=1 Tax=Thermosporothrix hazakensis TaxID=644383 RepID=A0A326TRK0_THEHA|nr:hypothetical protein EI42_06139 [Thermosporothrix hazakensis]GCE48235.1 hypothetical protein KTH_31040 [Thermosporothrix hazakensis]
MVQGNGQQWAIGQQVVLRGGFVPVRVQTFLPGQAVYGWVCQINSQVVVVCCGCDAYGESVYSTVPLNVAHLVMSSV